MHLPRFCTPTRISLPAALLLAATITHAQSPSPQSPLQFDVASIRQNLSDHTARSHIISNPADSHLTVINVPLKSLLQFAFALPDARILGGPPWLATSKWDIEARADASVDAQLHALPSTQARLLKQQMLQALLADRFGLVTHTETRDLPVYTLVLAKGGPKFSPSQTGGTTIDAGRGKLHIQGSDHTLTLLADALGKILGRPVLDQTALEGRFDLTLQWTPEDEAAPQAPPAPNSTSPSNTFPTLPTALQEQLGLKLQSTKAQIEVLIIDKATLPTPN